MKAKQREKVHFVFRAHPTGERYLPKKYDDFRGTLIVEDAIGIKKGKEFEPKKFGKPQFTYGRTQVEYIDELLKRNGKVNVGESFTTDYEKKQLLRHNYIRNNIIGQSINLWDLKLFKEAMIEIGKIDREIRHKLIKQTISETKEPVVSRYGTMHSTLSRELQKIGIKSSREIDSQQFEHFSILRRKMLLNKRISKIDIKRAFISLKILYSIGEKFISSANLSNKDKIILIPSITFHLIENLSQKQLDKIISEKDLNLLCKFNNLPTNPTRKELMLWLDKNSVFWRTHYGSRARERKQEIFEARKKRKK